MDIAFSRFRLRHDRRPLVMLSHLIIALLNVFVSSFNLPKDPWVTPQVSIILSQRQNRARRAKGTAAGLRFYYERNRDFCLSNAPS